MRMRRILRIILICAFVAVPVSADMTTVNIDFQAPDGSWDGGGYATLYSGVGMAADSGTYWNEVGIADVFDLLASDGATATTIDVSSTYVRTYANTGNDLLRDRLIWSDGGNHPGTPTVPAINISGLDATLQYNIYLYAGYYGQTYVIDGVSKDLTGLGWNDNQPSWAQGTHYVSFLGVSPTGGSIDIDIYNTAPTDTVVSGMQIQAVPVPGAALLGILGLGIANWRLRRRETV